MGTIGGVLEWWARSRPDGRAICFAGDVLTFAQLHEWTNRVASDLRSAGLEPGDRVGIFGTNSLEWCVAAIAVMKAGAIMVALNYRYTATEVSSVVADCAPRFLFTDEARGGRLGALGQPSPTVLPLTDIRSRRTGAEVSFEGPYDPDATIVIAYTSGSTAKPKGVMFSHRTTLAYAFESTLNYPQFRVGAKSINMPPLYTGGGTVQLIHFLNLGMTSFIEPEFSAERALQLVVDERIEILCGVPTFLERIAALPGFATADVSHIKLAAVGGARVPLALLKTWLSKGVVLRQLYGLTEGGGNTTIMPAEGAIEHPEQCGNGGAFTRHRVVDPEGRDCPPGVPGEIWVRGPAVMKGYWNAPAATAATFAADGWLKTGDVAIADAAGNLTVVDRLKDIIISGGLNIWPLDIETVISGCPGVAEVAVIGAKDEKFGETPLAIIYANGPLEVSDVINRCNQQLSDYKVPRYVVIEKEPLPRLATGKLSKRELKVKYANAADTLRRVR
jgi:fatty-acyl-CoA synthase